MLYIIDHQRYGVRSEFSSLREAQRGLRACGPDFHGTTLAERGEQIVDERGDVVGKVWKDPAAVKLGSKTSARKAAASRRNGVKGGRPKAKRSETKGKQ